MCHSAAASQPAAYAVMQMSSQQLASMTSSGSDDANDSSHLQQVHSALPRQLQPTTAGGASFAGLQLLNVAGIQQMRSQATSSQMISSPSSRSNLHVVIPHSQASLAISQCCHKYLHIRPLEFNIIKKLTFKCQAHAKVPEINVLFC